MGKNDQYNYNKTPTLCLFQWYDCAGATEATQEDIGKFIIIHDRDSSKTDQKTTTKHIAANTCVYFYGCTVTGLILGPLWCIYMEFLVVLWQRV